MSRKSKRRSAQKAHSRTSVQNRPAEQSVPRELVIGELMGALLSAITFGAVATEA